MDIFNRIRKLLDDHHFNYKIIEHLPTYTSEESAKHRSEPLKIGAKAMILKTDKEFIMAVLPADRKIDSSALKKYFNTKNLRFATKEELFELTGLVPGSVPPFGSLFSLRMVVDTALFEEEFMAFNAGSLEKSIKMNTRDYQKIVQPENLSFSSIK